MAYNSSNFAKKFCARSPFKSHPSKELDRLQSERDIFQKQYDDDPYARTKQDLDHAEKLLQEYMMDPHDEAS
jgi:hypothetical protein